MTAIARPILALAAAVSLAACATTPRPDAAPDAKLSTEQFPIKVEDQPREMLLAAHTQGLSPNQRAALTELASDWRDTGRGPIRIQAPPGEAGRRIGDAARVALIAGGLPDNEVLLTPYDVQAADAPVKISFVKRQVVLPDCAVQWGNMTSTSTNAVHQNFGCAVSANMAAQTADPADLLGARPMDPADAGRRQVVLDKYRRGEVTAADTPKTNGYVSDAVKN